MKKGLPLAIVVFYILTSLLVKHSFWYGLPIVLIALYLLNKEKFIDSVFKTDWASSFKNYYLSIDFVYRRSFWVVFGVLNVVFLYHGVQFQWGNHDWHHILFGVEPFYQNFAGRFSGGWGHIFLSERILPLLTNMVSLFGITLGGILLAKYWGVRKNLYSVIVFSLFIGVCPFILSWFYYLVCLGTYLWLPALVVAAFLIAESTNKENFLAYTLLSVLCLVSALGAYNSVLNTIGVVLLGRIFLLYYFENKSLKEILCQLKFIFLNIFISFGIYIAIIKYLQKKSYMQDDGYNTQIVSIVDLPQKLLDLLVASFKQFVVSFPFIDKSYLNTLLLLLALVLIVFIYNLVKNKSYRFFVALILFLLTLFATKTIAILANADIFHVPRIDWFGLMFFYAFLIAFLTKVEIKFIRNVLFALMIVILQMSIVRDVEAQKVWQMGFKAEQEVFLNVTRKIESSPNFDKNKSYELVYVGMPPSLRENYFDKNKFKYKLNSGDLMESTYIIYWHMQEPFRFYAPNIKFARWNAHFGLNNRSINWWNDKPQICKIIEDLTPFIETKAQEFPKEDSIYIDDKYIVVVWNLDEKDFVLNYCKDEQ